MNKPKISIIVAAYNTEKYVGKCLDSILNQDYKNIELIIIEDCSTDKTKKIIENYTENKNCKIYFNEVNKGLAYSRNLGLKNATGEYIGFVDSDDFIAPDYYSKMMSSIIDNKSEVAICDIKLIYENNNNEVITKCYENNEFNLLNVVSSGMSASACNKLFKADIIKKYEFAVGKINEDIAVVIPSLVNSKKISYASDCYYNYIQRNNSIQNANFSEKRFDIFEAVEATLERIKNSKLFDELKEAIIFNQLILLLIYVIPKEKRFFYRNKILRKYYKLSINYDIRKNKLLWNFLEKTGKKHKIYYKILLKLECNGMCFFANILISIFKFLTLILKKRSVIKKNITLNDLIKLSKVQKSMRDEEISVSVVVPNYNYEKFMYERLYSILNQNYKLKEIIILDDCSKDNSRELIDELVDKLKYNINIKKIYNDKNSGSAFKQWQKGFEHATGDYVWIAEADDYCERQLIKTLIKPIKNNDKILISYSDTSFINSEGKKIMKTIKPEIDIRKTGHWNKSYINSGLDEIKGYSFLNCTIANVSSCIIKNGNYNEYLKESGKLKQAGDWLFYVNVMKDGYISYTNKILNYYRVHGNNVSSTMNYKKHIDEINFIHNYYIDKFRLSTFHKNEMKKRIDFLKKCWNVK